VCWLTLPLLKWEVACKVSGAQQKVTTAINTSDEKEDQGVCKKKNNQDQISFYSNLFNAVEISANTSEFKEYIPL